MCIGQRWLWVEGLKWYMSGFLLFVLCMHMHACMCVCVCLCLLEANWPSIFWVLFLLPSPSSKKKYWNCRSPLPQPSNSNSSLHRKGLDHQLSHFPQLVFVPLNSMLLQATLSSRNRLHSSDTVKEVTVQKKVPGSQWSTVSQFSSVMQSYTLMTNQPDFGNGSICWFRYEPLTCL